MVRMVHRRPCKLSFSSSADKEGMVEVDKDMVVGKEEGKGLGRDKDPVWKAHRDQRRDRHKDLYRQPEEGYSKEELAVGVGNRQEHLRS